VTRIVEIRVIAATHRDLQRLVRTGDFREDLYYRLNVVQIDLPPLRERREDIGLLASYFLERAMREAGKPGMSFSPEAMATLERYDYPGNVRELENLVERAVLFAEGSVIGVAELPPAVRAPRLLPENAEPDVERPTRGAEGAFDGADAREAWSLADVEKEHIQRVLARHQGNATTAARQLGISRTTLWRKLRHYGLKRTGS